MKKDEQQRADELEKIIQAKQQQQPIATRTAEGILAEELIELAERTNPSSKFVADLEKKLQQRAKQLQTKKIASDKPSFWRDLQHLLKEGLPMKPVQLLGGATIILLMGVFAIALVNFTRDNGEQVEPELLPVASLPENDANQSENPVVETLPENDAATSGVAEPNAEIAEALPPQEGAPLPRFNSQPMGGGLGGGGGAATSSMPIAEGGFDMMMSDPFSGTIFTLNTAFPTEPAAGIVQYRAGEATIDAALAQQIATAYGFSGPLYTEMYPSEVPMDGPSAPPMSYIAFDGARSLRIDPWAISYVNETAATSFDYEDSVATIPNAATIAETFLQERGQLDFAYELRVNEQSNSVEFYRLVQDTAVNEPELSVTLNKDGEVVWVWDSVPGNYEDPRRYPLISAEAAWQKVLEGVTANQIMYRILGEDPFVGIPVEPLPIDQEYQSWPRTYSAGSEVHFYDWPIVYQPVGGGTPLVKVRNYTIQVDDATLNSLADNRDSQIHLWGTLNADNSLALAGWEPLATYEPIFLQGIVQQENGQLIFVGNEGATYILPDAPTDIENGLEVTVFGFGIRDIGLTYPVLDWESIDKYIEYPEEPIGIPIESEPIDGMPIEPFMPMGYENVQIDGVELAYVVTYMWPEMNEEDLETMMRRPSPTIYLQPAWQFTGTAETGEKITLWVQAVEESYLQQ